MDLVVQYVSTLKIPTNGISAMVWELSKMIIRIWKFIVADCVCDIEDMQEKICCKRIVDGVILDLIQLCFNRILDPGEN